MPEQVASSPYKRGFRAAVDGMKLALRSKDLGRAYLRVAAVVFVLTILIDSAAIWTLFHFTAVPGDAAWWLIALLWAARVIGTIGSLLIGPLLAIFTINIAFPVFNKEIFLAGLRIVDPARAEALAAKPGMPLGVAVGIPLWRLFKFLASSVCLLLLGLVPVVGSIAAAILQTWLTARTVAWEMMDPYFDCLDIRYAEQKHFVARMQKPLLGFGLPVSLMLAIPIIGPLTFGIAQVAAAMFVAREFPVDPRELGQPVQAS